MSGKGSASRPLSVDTQTYAHRWEATFRAPAAEPADDDGDGALILPYTHELDDDAAD
jgi:hypothetical protein